MDTQSLISLGAHLSSRSVRNNAGAAPPLPLYDNRTSEKAWTRVTLSTSAAHLMRQRGVHSRMAEEAPALGLDHQRISTVR